MLRPLLARWPQLLVVWGLATAAGLWTAATTAIGPVLLRLTNSHGVHLGDVVALVIFYGAAAVVTGRIALSSVRQ
jgi:hypothetical protein